MSYNRQNPHFGHIEERYLLNKSGSSKETWHVRLNIEESGIQFRVGDSVGILPKNDARDVVKTLDLFQVHPDQICIDPRSQLKKTAFELLSQVYSLRNIPKKALLKIVEYIPESRREEFLVLLEKDESWVRVQELSDWLQFAQTSVPFEEILSFLQPLLPRFYSIASSQKALPHGMDLAVARVSFEAHGKSQVGVCSQYLTTTAPIGNKEIGLYIQPTTHFLFPHDDLPTILIGPGTGVAPFRAYLQEKVARGCSAPSWLFFGERQSSVDFLYKDFWDDLSNNTFFQMDVAFSRDTEEKVYVQHKIWEKRKEILAWIENGARIYVCGAIQMGKDVEEMLILILQEKYQGDRAQAFEAVKELRKLKRILKDVY